MFLVGVFVLAVLSGGTASVAGFGIGSLLTPLLAASLGIGTAVAAVAIPHAAATALRCWRLRSNIDWAVLRGFGLLSAAGGLIGALLYTRFSNDALTLDPRSAARLDGGCDARRPPLSRPRRRQWSSACLGSCRDSSVGLPAIRVACGRRRCCRCPCLRCATSRRRRRPRCSSMS